MIRMERSFAGWVAKATFHSFQAVFLRLMGTATSLKRFASQGRAATAPGSDRARGCLHGRNRITAQGAYHFRPPIYQRSASGLDIG
jgi:hypothetical protein